MSEAGEFYVRALPRGADIVLEKESEAWSGALYAGGRVVRWRGDDPSLAVEALAAKWMAAVREDVEARKAQG